jgi:hypothetical protein
VYLGRRDGNLPAALPPSQLFLPNSTADADISGAKERGVIIFAWLKLFFISFRRLRSLFNYWRRSISQRRVIDAGGSFDPAIEVHQSAAGVFNQSQSVCTAGSASARDDEPAAGRITSGTFCDRIYIKKKTSWRRPDHKRSHDRPLSMQKSDFLVYSDGNQSCCFVSKRGRV